MDLDLFWICLTFPQNKMFRGYEEPSDFSLERSGCLLQPSLASPSSSERDDRGPDDDFDGVVTSVCVNHKWVVLSNSSSLRRQGVVRDNDEDESNSTLERKTKKIPCPGLDIYDKSSGGTHVRAYFETSKGSLGGDFYFSSVDISGDVIFAVACGSSAERDGVQAIAFEAVYGEEDGKMVAYFAEIWRIETLARGRRQMSASIACLHLRGGQSRTLVVTACGARDFAESWLVDAESGDIVYEGKRLENQPYYPKVWPVVAQVSIEMEEGCYAVFARTRDRKRIESFQVVEGKYTASLHDEGEIPRVTRGLDQYIGGLCALPATCKDSEHAHPKLCVAFSEDSAHLNALHLKRGMARHVMKRDSVVRIVMYNVTIATSKKTGLKKFVHAEETHRVELEDSIVTSPIDLDSMTSSPVSSSYIFFAHVNGDVSIVLPRTGVVLKTLSAAHDPKSLASTGSVNFVVANRAYLSASKCAEDATICLFSSAGRLTSCWSIASPLVWTPQTHHLFPKPFRDASKTFLLCCARLGRDSTDTTLALLSASSSKRQHAMNENRLRRRKDIDASLVLTEKEFKDLVFALSCHEPALIERIVGALAVVTFNVKQ